MKINGHNPYTRIESARGRETSAAETDGRASSGVRGEAAEVQVSDAARALVEARAPERPDQARIDRLKGAIARGELVIDARKIAARMMEEEG